jgi:hypothetical protein
VARAGLTVLLAAAVVAGCGGHASPPAKTTAAGTTTASAVCRSLALALVDDARGLLQAYGGNPSPGDLAMYDLREHVAYVQSNGCAPATAGAALAAKLSDRRFAAFVALLPTAYARNLEQARSCAMGSKPAESCTAAVEPVSLPGAKKPGGTPHPLVP